MKGTTLIDAPKETDSRSRKFVLWHNDCITKIINGKAKNFEDKFDLHSNKEKKMLKMRLIDFCIDCNKKDLAEANLKIQKSESLFIKKH